MTTPDDSCEKLDVRSKWPSESLDFTRWLACHLDKLGDAISLNLEFVGREKLIDSMYLDILARDVDTGALVAIENQLEWSDIDHLGRLLIYTAGVDAKVAVWVAPDFYRPYARVLHWLNESTREGVRFYCVKVELFKCEDDSEAKPRFRKVVYPGGWDEDATIPPLTPSPEAQKYQAFFQPLIAELLRSNFADKATQLFARSDRFFPCRFSPTVGYAVTLEARNNAWVTLHIGTDSRGDKRLFDALSADREAIESSIDAGPSPDWHWQRYDRFYFSSISVRRDGSIEDPPGKLEKTRAWMLELLPRFKECFDPYIERILSDLDRGN